MKVQKFLSVLTQLRTAIAEKGEYAAAYDAMDIFPELRTLDEARKFIRTHFARELASFRAAQTGPAVRAFYAKNA